MAKTTLKIVIVCVVSSCLWLTSRAFGSYSFTYLCLMTTLLVVLILHKNILTRTITGFYIGYLGIGLLNVSSYRGEISLETIDLYYLCLFFFYAPIVLFVHQDRLDQPVKYKYSKTKALELVTTGHLIIVYGATLYVYATKGLVLIHQDLRFGIPTSLAYTIRSSLFIPMIFMCMRSWRPNYRFLCFALMCILPSFLIGSRSTGLVAIFSMVIFYLVALADRDKFSLYSKIKIGALVASVSYLAIGVGFYVRRAYSPDLMTGTELINSYFAGNTSFYIYMILPFHQGFNETAALTSRVIDQGIQNLFSTTILFLADFNNLLGRSNIAAAQYFGDEIGRVGGGGLTPGVIGGLYMDIQAKVVLAFLAFGGAYAALLNLSKKNKLIICIVSIYATQYMHLFHRGFVKPEYITVFIITLVYMALLRKSVNEN